MFSRAGLAGTFRTIITGTVTDGVDAMIASSYKRKRVLLALLIVLGCALLLACAAMTWETPIDPFGGQPVKDVETATDPQTFSHKVAILVPSGNTREWTMNWANAVQYSGNSDNGASEGADFVQLVNTTAAQANISNASTPSALQGTRAAERNAAALSAFNAIGNLMSISQLQANATDPRPILSALNSILLTRFTKTKGAKTLEQAKYDASCGAIVYIDFQRNRSREVYMVLGSTFTDEFTANLFFLDCSGRLIRKFGSTQKLSRSSTTVNPEGPLAEAEGPAITAMWQQNFDAASKWLTPPAETTAADAITQSKTFPTDAAFDACFARCRKSTDRSKEQCFDICRH